MQRRRENKTRDKPLADPHREYLDAESSDEAEGKGEQDEEEKLTGISKHIYQIGELEKLITYVKDFTNISGLSEDNWTDQCYAGIQAFFCNLRINVLTIYFKDGILMTEPNFPTIPIYELTYFIKNPHETLTPENFHQNIISGTINDHVESSVLSTLENVIAPIFLNMDASINSVSTDFNASMQESLCKLTDLRYKMLGLTVIYQPVDVSDLTIEEASADKKLVKRLEEIVVHWTQQIRIALGDKEQITPHELRCLIDEYRFWFYRYDNLRGLTHQLQNPLVKHIISILTNTQSTNVRQFVSLNDEIESNVKESKSNIDFLRVLKKPCSELDACATPSQLTRILPKIIHLLRAMWLNSPYLNSYEKMTHLFSLLSNQIIVVCRYRCNMKDIFTGHTRKGIRYFQECIKVCEEYKKLYNLVIVI